MPFRHSRYIAGSGFRPLSKIPHCCPPLESGPCLSPGVADHPKRPAKHHRLGPPLPYQLPNTTKALQTARIRFFGIWPELFGRFPRVTHPCATLLSTGPTKGRQELFKQGAYLCVLPDNNVRLACVKHIASVPSEPGSNSIIGKHL